MLVEAYYRNPLAATPQPLSGHEISGYRRANPSGSKRDNAQENERLIQPGAGRCPVNRPRCPPAPDILGG